MNNLTKEDFLDIEKKLGYLINNWYIELFNTIVTLAKNSNVKQLYWNSSETVDGGSNGSKKNFFYETLPSRLGFVKTKANLRNRGEESLWLMNLDRETYSSDGLIHLNQIPQRLQGGVIGILKSRGPYTKEQLRPVFEILKKQADNPQFNKRKDTYSYNDAESWDGGQQFAGMSETIVKQKLNSRLINHILETGSEATKKFLSNLINSSQHFDANTIGWALIAKISPDVWVINQIQTDTLNRYLKARSEALKEVKMEDEVLSLESIKDRVFAATRSSIWANKVENDSAFFQALQNNIELVRQLPSDVDLAASGIGHDEWWSTRRTANSNSKIKTSFNLSSNIKKSNRTVFNLRKATKRD